MRSSRRAAAEHGASTSAEPAIWGRQAARQRSGWGQQDNAHGELATQIAEVDATPLLDIAYHTTSDPRDALGRITKKTEWLDGTTTAWTYSYDSLNRLHVVTKNGQPFATYTYDLNGNRLTVDGSTTIATYDDQDRLLSYDGTTYTYGANGELKTKTTGTDTTTYTYDALNNLRQVVLPNADVIEYLVDGLGRRVGKKKNGTLVKRWLFKDQLEPIAEIDEPSGNVRRFIYASRAHVPDLMIDHSGVAYRLLTDQLGSVRLVVRVDNGNVVQHVDYDPWGVPTVVTGNWDVQSFGFAGGVYDGETELVRFGARDYDARVGRWTGKDPVRFDGGVNLYVYVGNDPIGFIDPTGLTTEACERPIDLDDVFKKTLRTFLRLNLLLSPLWATTSDSSQSTTEICRYSHHSVGPTGIRMCVYSCRGGRMRAKLMDDPTPDQSGVYPPGWSQRGGCPATAVFN